MSNNITSNSQSITPTQFGYLSGVTSNIQTQIGSATSDIALKAPLNSATLTGTPTTPDVSANDNTGKVANTKYVDTAIANLISSAPSTLNTLQELATALGNDSNFSATMVTAFAGKAPINNATMTGTTTTASLSCSGNATLSALTRATEISENISNYGAISSNTISANFNNGSIFYCAPASGTNLTCNITNIPTSNTYCTYTLTFILDASTYKVYINTLTVNSSSYTMIANGGLANVSVDSSSTCVIQQISIIFTSSATVPYKVVTSVLSLF